MMHGQKNIKVQEQRLTCLHSGSRKLFRVRSLVEASLTINSFLVKFRKMKKIGNVGVTT